MRLSFLRLIFLLCLFSHSAYSDTAQASPETSAAQEETASTTIDAQPIAVYLSWITSPESSIVISWVTKTPSATTTPKVHTAFLKKAPPQGYKEKNQHQAKSDSTTAEWASYPAHTLPFPENNPYEVHSTFIDGLEPDTLYMIAVEDIDTCCHTFQTAPTKLNSLRFVIGGDTYKDDEFFRQTNLMAASYNPLFAVLGGDLAYATPAKKSDPENCEKWISWLKSWYETMRCRDVGDKVPSRLIPMLTVIGNHEVKGRYDQTPKEAPFFYTLFRKPFLAKSYYTLRFSNYLSFYLLDSGHTVPVGQEQKAWLAKEMKQDLLVRHKVACYHVPAYPSVRYYRNEMSEKIRRHWIPIFDKYRLHLAFENHDHAYKRTFPLRNNEIHPRGVIYIGDGSWGTQERVPKKASKTSYLLKTAQARQMCVVTIDMRSRKVSAVSPQQGQIDCFEELVDPMFLQTPPAPQAAPQEAVSVSS